MLSNVDPCWLSMVLMSNACTLFQGQQSGVSGYFPRTVPGTGAKLMHFLFLANCEHRKSVLSYRPQ